MYIVSKCLLGYKCKYDGGSNPSNDVIEFCKSHDYIAVCPESAAGLEPPRNPAEIVTVAGGSSRVLDKSGQDLTEIFRKGALNSLNDVMSRQGSGKADCKIEGAVLKARSPSCGSGVVYDGSFTGGLSAGNGVFTDMLIEACRRERSDKRISQEHRAFSGNFKVCDEENFREVLMDRD